MRVRIGCIDGNTYESDDVPESEIQEYLDANPDGITTGVLAGEFSVTTVDEFVDFFDKMISGSLEGMNTTEITLVIDGRNRSFKPETIVWHEIERD